MRLAAMSSMARVIFLVDCTLRMRRRRIRSWPPAMVELLRSQRLVGLGLADGFALERFDRGLGRGRRLEHCLEVLDRLLELRLLRELPGVADRGEQVGVTGPEEVVELGFEAPDVLDGEV